MIKYILKKISKRDEMKLRLHYEVEKSIADKIKRADKKQRQLIYKTMYDELFEKIPDHSRLLRREIPLKTNKAIKFNLNFLRKQIKQVNSFVEFAPGDAKLSIKIAETVSQVYAIDISNQLADNETIPRNMKLIIYDGYELNLPKNSIDLVFSNQLIEHFHPEETKEHFKIAYNLLKQGGVYVFKTPHRFSGPWDVSRYFSNIPQGFHLKEWTFLELNSLLNEIGFKEIKTYYYVKYFFFRFPLLYFIINEKIFSIFPKSIRRIVSFPFLPHIAIKAKK